MSLLKHYTQEVTIPNWCSNVVTFTHEDTAQIAKVAAAYSSGSFMQTFFPCPEDLLVTAAGNAGAAGTPVQIAHEAKQAANLAKYGYKDWYDWKVANWGAKWDVGKEGVDTGYADGDTSITLNFDTAWSPPIGFYEKMEDIDFVVEAYYYESGAAYCGIFEDGVDSEYDIDGDSDWVEKHIPRRIDEMFAISENMASGESEEED